MTTHGQQAISQTREKKYFSIACGYFLFYFFHRPRNQPSGVQTVGRSGSKNILFFLKLFLQKIFFLDKGSYLRFLKYANNPPNPFLTLSAIQKEPLRICIFGKTKVRAFCIIFFFLYFFLSLENKNQSGHYENRVVIGTLNQPAGNDYPWVGGELVDKK